MTAFLASEPWWYWALFVLAVVVLIGAVIWWRDVREDAKDDEAWARMPGAIR